MLKYSQLTKPELEALYAELSVKYEEFKSRGLKLDMSRGRPGADQLDMSNDFWDVINSASNIKTQAGFDCRNYGLFEGIPECRQMFAELLEVDAENILVGGNSSLSLMFDFVSQCMTHGTGGGEPWAKLDKVKFLCPVPGYDRHFTICEHFGIEMVNIPMLDDGPDMDAIEQAVKDESVKGMFCVPKYSNPEGKTFSDPVVRRIAALKPAANDFRIVWDNAYFVHDLTDTSDVLLNIIDEAKKFGNEDMIVEVASTSKISFPGAGIAAIAASYANIAEIKNRLFVQTICNDKVNQLRHVLYFKDADGIRAQMKRHAEILRPKFETVLNAFDSELGGTGAANWNRPNGGYFISLDVMDGCAKRVVSLCAQAGVTLTPAGATFPYNNDPNDRNIRIAPTYPSPSELASAVELLCLCVRLAVVEKLINQ